MHPVHDTSDLQSASMSMNRGEMCFALPTSFYNCVVGIVHWKPPSQAMDAVIASAGDHSLNQYGSGAGLPDLIKALKQKLVTQNGLEQVHMFGRKERKRKVYACYA